MITKDSCSREETLSQGWLAMVRTLPVSDLQRGSGWNFKKLMTLMKRIEMHLFNRGGSLQGD